MAESVIRDATLDAAMIIADGMRESDVSEVWYSSLQSPEESVVTSLEASEEAHVGVFNGVPWGIWGVARCGSDGIPWCLGTDAMDRRPATVLRYARNFISSISKRYDTLFNQVHAENHRSITLMRALGFHVDPPRQWGMIGNLFHRVWRKCHV